mgnify:FL=1
MDASKITLASYIRYLQTMYKRCGNISLNNLNHIERNKRKETNNEQTGSKAAVAYY